MMLECCFWHCQWVRGGRLVRTVPAHQLLFIDRLIGFLGTYLDTLVGGISGFVLARPGRNQDLLIYLDTWNRGDEIQVGVVGPSGLVVDMCLHFRPSEWLTRTHATSFGISCLNELFVCCAAKRAPNNLFWDPACLFYTYVLWGLKDAMNAMQRWFACEIRDESCDARESGVWIYCWHPGLGIHRLA